MCTNVTERKPPACPPAATHWPHTPLRPCPKHVCVCALAPVALAPAQRARTRPEMPSSLCALVAARAARAPRKARNRTRARSASQGLARARDSPNLARLPPGLSRATCEALSLLPLLRPRLRRCPYDCASPRAVAARAETPFWSPAAVSVELEAHLRRL